MKRPRNIDAENAKTARSESSTAATTLAGVEGKKNKVDEEMKEDRKIDNEDSSLRMVESYLSWGRELPWLGGVVDEQMSWSSIWLPFWDVEYMGDACSQMFSDVVWDYDIWNLRNIDEVPHP